MDTNWKTLVNQGFSQFFYVAITFAANYSRFGNCLSPLVLPALVRNLLTIDSNCQRMFSTTSKKQAETTLRPAPVITIDRYQFILYHTQMLYFPNSLLSSKWQQAFRAVSCALSFALWQHFHIEEWFYMPMLPKR